MSRVFLPVFAFFCFGVALVALRWLVLSPEALITQLTMPESTSRMALWAHIYAAPLTLMAGFLQMLPGLRARRPLVHRWSGLLYVAAVTVAALGGLGLALSSWAERPSLTLGFGLLAVLWLVTTWRALLFALARPRRLDAHRAFMIRSFALTFAAVVLRLELPLFLNVGGMGYAQASQILAWLSWVPNLLVAEWLVRRR